MRIGKVLVDTHCLMWALADSPSLSDAMRNAIMRADSVCFSEASIWEIGLKWRKGKINLQPRRIVDQALRDGFKMIAISLEAILLSVDRLFTHTRRLDRAEEAYQMFDQQTGGKGVFLM